MLFYICFKIHYAPCAIAVIVLMYLLYWYFSPFMDVEYDIPKQKADTLYSNMTEKLPYQYI